MTGAPDEAFRLDAAIDELLVAGPTGRAGTADLDLAPTAALLVDVLPRFHPRFGFEEDLARRLSGRAHGADGPGAPLTPFARHPSVHPASPVAGAIGASSGPGAVSLGSRRTRRAKLGRGAIASGVALISGVSIALPLAGAVVVRWRRARADGRAGGMA